MRNFNCYALLHRCLYCLSVAQLAHPGCYCCISLASLSCAQFLQCGTCVPWRIRRTSLQLADAGNCGCHQRNKCMLHHYTCPAGNPFAPNSGTDAVSAPPMPSWGTGQDAAAPPASASASGFDTSPSGGFVQPKPFAPPADSAAQSSAVPGGALDNDNESCVVCMSAPAQAGFVHGSRSAILHQSHMNAVAFA